MSNRSYPHPYLRYLKARLFFFRQPAFWSISIFVLSVGMLTWEYWLKPNYFSEQQTSPVTLEKPIINPDVAVSDEDKSITADIDNLPVLLNDFSQDQLVENINDFPSNYIPINNQNFLEDVINRNNTNPQSKNATGLPENVTPTIQENPFVTQTNNLLNSVSPNIHTQVIDANTTNKTIASNYNRLPEPAITNLRTILANPLEIAIKQSKNFINTGNTYIPVTNRVTTPVSPPSNSMEYIAAPRINQNMNTGQTSIPVTIPTSNVYPGNLPIQNNTYPIGSINSTTTPMNNVNSTGYGVQTPNQPALSNVSSSPQLPGQYQSGYRN